jgi:hypothetical protein
VHPRIRVPAAGRRQLRRLPARADHGRLRARRRPQHRRPARDDRGVPSPRRGIYPDGVFSLSEDSLRWPAAPRTRTPFPGKAIATGLVTGAKAFRPRGEVAPPPGRPADPSFQELREWIQANRAALSLDREEKVALDAFHANYRVRPDGELAVEVVAQCTQKVDTTDDPRFGGLPLRGGTTIVAAADGTLRFAIAKPLSQARKAAQIEFVDRSDLADPLAAWGSGRRYAMRARASMQRLHQGLVE